MAADAGFVATGMMAPEEGSDSGAHKTVALTSMGIAAAGYAYMLFTR